MTKKYKSGQVASALFSNKTDTGSALSKLFSSSTTSTNTQHSAIFGNTVSPKTKKGKSSSGKSPKGTEKTAKSVKRKLEAPQVTDASSPGSPKKSKKKKKKKSQNDVEDSADYSSSIVHETLVNKTSAGDNEASSKKSKKRKSETGTEEGGELKRPRRNRVRTKTADNRTIFVGNCPLSADKKTLMKLFKGYGKIETVRFRCAPPGDPNLPRRAIVITKNFHEQCDSLVAYVVFEEEKSAHKALEKNGCLLEDLHLRVDLASSAKKHDKKRSIFVGNLPFTVKEEDIRSHFEDCGEVVNVRIVRDRMTSLGKGICYVQFDSKDAVSLSLKLNGSDFRGRPLRVMTCANKPKRKDKDAKGGKTANSKANKSKEEKNKKKLSFAPSNLSSTSFKTKLQEKKEKRLRKFKKKKEVAKAKWSDGLSGIFGDIPAAAKTKAVKKKSGTGKSAAKGKSAVKGKSFPGGKKAQKGFNKGPKKFSQKGKGMKGKRKS